MALWQVVNDDWYNFITFKIYSYVSEEQQELNKALSGTDGTEGEMNLWRCRHCGAMVPGVARNTHERFHNNFGYR
jgi:hypothetical protein